jgi:hypothetical protein
MDVKFRYVPQYIEQSFAGDPRYARIEALIHHGRCDVILLDKTTNREAFYSTANREVEVLMADGADAYTAPIDFSASWIRIRYFGSAFTTNSGRRSRGSSSSVRWYRMLRRRSSPVRTVPAGGFQ